MPIDRRTVTSKRRTANRAAAQKSTGPRTPEGKQRAALNSFQHGAFASEPHILESALARSGSDSAAFAARRQSLLDDWRPASAQQRLLVDDLAWFYWLRDQSALALVEGRAQRQSRAQLERDQRRFDARHRAPAVNYDDFATKGYAALEASEAKFSGMTDLLANLEDLLAAADWKHDKNPGLATAADIIDYLYGKDRSTARGQKLGDLWQACAAAKAKAKDPRASEIRALIAEEREALAEEETLFRRRQELDIEQPEVDGERPGLDPLGETWQRTVLGIERLDRQVNAKVRLLLRLQEHAAKTSADARISAPQPSSERDAVGAGLAPPRAPQAAPLPSTAMPAESAGTKPIDALESIPEAVVERAFAVFGLPAPREKAAEEGSADLRS